MESAAINAINAGRDNKTIQKITFLSFDQIDKIRKSLGE